MGGEAGTYAPPPPPSTPGLGQGTHLQASELVSLGRFLTNDHPCKNQEEW